MTGGSGTRRSVRPHLGVGWAFPVRPEGGRLRWAEYEEDVEQAIRIILETARNERVMKPRFGSQIHDYLFAGNSAVNHRAVEDDVRRALVDWEPRIDVERVTASADEDDTSLMLIEVDYVVRRTNAFYNLVYPFYLTEAG